MYQLDMWCNDFESRLDILAFEIQQQVSSPIGFFPSRCLPPDRLLKRCTFVDRKTGLRTKFPKSSNILRPSLLR